MHFAEYNSWYFISIDPAVGRARVTTVHAIFYYLLLPPPTSFVGGRKNFGSHGNAGRVSSLPRRPARINVRVAYSMRKFLITDGDAVCGMIFTIFPERNSRTS